MCNKYVNKKKTGGVEPPVQRGFFRYMGLLLPSSGRSKPESVILQFPSSRRYAVRVERERHADGWLVVTHDRSHGWLHGNRNAALADARLIAAEFGVSVISS
jgi:hypothetical protein